MKTKELLDRLDAKERTIMRLTRRLGRANWHLNQARKNKINAGIAKAVQDIEHEEGQVDCEEYITSLETERDNLARSLRVAGEQRNTAQADLDSVRSVLSQVRRALGIGAVGNVVEAAQDMRARVGHLEAEAKDREPALTDGNGSGGVDSFVVEAEHRLVEADYGR